MIVDKVEVEEMKLDEVDERIIELLKKNARIPVSHISREIGLSNPSIKDRLDKLEAGRVILGYRPLLDYSKLGLGLTAFVNITLDPSRCCDDDIVLEIKKLSQVVEGHFTDGEADMLVKVIVRDTESLKDTLNMIREIDGVFTTQTIISLTNPIRQA